MPKLDISRSAKKFIEKLFSSQPKHAKQIAAKLDTLKTEPYPNDSKKLKGRFESFHRVDIGEYRIVYRFSQDDNQCLLISWIGKRNDSEIYK